MLCEQAQCVVRLIIFPIARMFIYCHNSVWCCVGTRSGLKDSRITWNGRTLPHLLMKSPTQIRVNVSGSKDLPTPSALLGPVSSIPGKSSASPEVVHEENMTLKTSIEKASLSLPRTSFLHGLAITSHRFHDSRQLTRSKPVQVYLQQFDSIMTSSHFSRINIIKAPALSILNKP